MELQIDRERRELKNHGTYSFPVNLSRKKLSSYLSGAFPWHWHDEVELTLVLHGEIDYRVNDSRYLLHRGEGLFCNADALHAGAMSGEIDCEYLSLTFHPRLLSGFEGSVIGKKYVEGIVNKKGLSSILLTSESVWQQAALDSFWQRYTACFRKSRSCLNWRYSGCCWVSGANCTGTMGKKQKKRCRRTWKKLSACGQYSPIFMKITRKNLRWKMWPGRRVSARANAAAFSSGKWGNRCSTICWITESGAASLCCRRDVR